MHHPSIHRYRCTRVCGDDRVTAPKKSDLFGWVNRAVTSHMMCHGTVVPSQYQSRFSLLHFIPLDHIVVSDSGMRILHFLTRTNSIFETPYIVTKFPEYLSALPQDVNVKGRNPGCIISLALLKKMEFDTTDIRVTI
jgi:hypothetical protein